MLGDNRIVAALHYPTSGKSLTGGGTEGLEVRSVGYRSFTETRPDDDDAPIAVVRGARTQFSVGCGMHPSIDSAF